MEKIFYKKSELIKLGYPESLIDAVIHSDCADMVILPRLNSNCAFRINKEKFDKYVSRIIKNI